MAEDFSNQFPSIAGCIAKISEEAANRTDLAALFKNCFPNTLATTVEILPDGNPFIITGDIPAMWLRDSSAQVRVYIPFLSGDPALARIVRGTIVRQAEYILIDAYANAFNREPNGQHTWADHTEMGSWVWERKFELDSLCYPVQLLKDYWEATQDASIFDWKIYAALRRIVEVMQIEQDHDQRSGYFFERDHPEWHHDTLARAGRGNPTNPTGMIWSGFRPSDDACRFGYHIPANMFAVVVLEMIADFAVRFYQDQELSSRAKKLMGEVRKGIQTYGRCLHPKYGWIYAYETDGFGNYNLMDDANVPSLLSIPFLSYCSSSDPDYQRTRDFLLSPDNPYYYRGKYANGIGSPHTPAGHIWPIALIMEGMTSDSPDEKVRLLNLLAQTTAGTHLMHESFQPDDPQVFTRPWFAWANSLFSQYLLQLSDEGILSLLGKS